MMKDLSKDQLIAMINWAQHHHVVLTPDRIDRWATAQKMAAEKEVAPTKFGLRRGQRQQVC